MHSSSTGFTLIELMIVVAVVGILAAASIPLYHGYVVKSQVNRVVAELGAYRSAFEAGVARSKSIDNAFLGYSPSDLTTGDSPTDIATINADGSGHIQVTLGGNAHPDVAGTIIRLERNAAGEWQCVIDTSAARRWKSAYTPGHCSVL